MDNILQVVLVDLGLIWMFMDNFLNSVPLKAWTWFSSTVFYSELAYSVTHHMDWVNAEWNSTWTKSMSNESPHRQSQDRVRLHVDLATAEWDSKWTESTRSETSHGLCMSISEEKDSTWTESMWSMTLHGLSQYGVRLNVDWANADNEISNELSQCSPHGLSQWGVRLHLGWANVA
jgi:hypothetical protein